MNTHPSFNKRPTYKDICTIEKYREKAKHARTLGFYNLETLWLYRKTWLESKDLSDYLNYLSFRRDMGYPITRNQKKRLHSWHKNPLSKLFFILTKRHSLTLKRKILREQIMHSDELQQFEKRLKNASSIQFVGNSGALINSKLGNHIDLADIVIRFNLSFSSESQTEDTGSKTDIWVGAPDFHFPAPTASWYILAGPDMLNWISQLPAAFRNKEPIFSIPLIYWRKLVRILAAPPSAGLLTLSWIINLAPNTQKHLCGFGSKDNIARHPYHHADIKHTAVQRHNWAAERNLLQVWHQKDIFHEGCKDLTE